MIINIDTGGTHTDAYLFDEEEEVQAVGKASTTHYDLSAGFMNAIEQAAAKMDLSIEEAIDRAEMVKYSTTTGVNAIIEKTGPRLGLITTRGFEDSMYIGKARNWADGLDREDVMNYAQAEKPEMLIPQDLRVGVPERIDSSGDVVMPLDEDAVREKVRYLVDQGVRGFVVCLLWSHENPVHEQRVKEIIEEEYPEVYLGNMPILLSSEISPQLDEYSRMMTTTLNAYMSNASEEHFVDILDKLHDYDYSDPLFAVRNTGGVSSISRTAPIHLFNAGPIAGVMGAQYLGNLYGESNVLATDMGGTSFDLGMVLDDRERVYEFKPVLDRYRFQLSIIETHSIGAGGGSIAYVDSVGKLNVGPKSAGADPGPACYSQGGTEATVTDADVVLGYLNPDYFLGGRQQLDKRRAERAIKRNVANPLGKSVEEAAADIRRMVDAEMGQEIHKQTAMKGHDPEDFVLFAFGGAGPVHACDYADYANASKIITFPFASVFNGFGASTMDLLQTYEESKHLTLYDSLSESYAHTSEDFDRFNDVVDRLMQEAVRDLANEGYDEDDASFSLELDCVYANQLEPTRFTSPLLKIESEDDVREICEAFTRTYADRYSKGATFPEGGVKLENFKLNALVQLDDPDLPTYELEDPDPSDALKGTREVFWSAEEGWTETRIYEHGDLEPGNVVEGPAIIEDVASTFVVTPDKEFTVDKYRNGVIESK